MIGNTCMLIQIVVCVVQGSDFDSKSADVSESFG